MITDNSESEQGGFPHVISSLKELWQICTFSYFLREKSQTSRQVVKDTLTIIYGRCKGKCSLSCCWILWLKSSSVSSCNYLCVGVFLMNVTLKVVWLTCIWRYSVSLVRRAPASSLGPMSLFVPVKWLIKRISRMKRKKKQTKAVATTWTWPMV